MEIFQSCPSLDIPSPRQVTYHMCTISYLKSSKLSTKYNKFNLTVFILCSCQTCLAFKIRNNYSETINTGYF